MSPAASKFVFGERMMENKVPPKIIYILIVGFWGVETDAGA